MGRIVCLVHGGAGALPDSGVGPAKEGTSAAAAAGFRVLAAGGSAVDAVEAAVRVLEDNPRFNAGTGSVLNRAGRVEMDCLIMEGAGLRAGAATLVSRVKNPVSLARAIMEGSPHVFLAGATADAFAEQRGLQMVDNAALVTPARREQLARTLEATGGATRMVSDPLSVLAPTASGATVSAGVSAAMAPAGSVAHRDGVDAGDHDTVGAVAVDADGNVAAATSTGGLTAKWVGRVGDTPVIGAGGYADNESGACSTTGTGEYIMRFGLARAVCEAYARLRAVRDAGAATDAAVTNGAAAAAGAAPPSLATAAVADVLGRMKARLSDPGEGVIFVAPDGDVGVGHSSHRMSWALVEGEAAPGAATTRVRAACGVQLGATGSSSGSSGVHVVVPPEAWSEPAAAAAVAAQPL
jgi:L-asparaginase / beta-aspartyl-peptidase